VAIVHFESLRASLEATPRLLESHPAAVELIDRFLLDKTRQNAFYAPMLTFVEGDPAAVLVVEYYGSSEKELDHHSANLKAILQRLGHQGAVTYASSAKEQFNVWEIRKAGLGLLTSERSPLKPLEFIEDAAVPVEKLADYISEVEQVILNEGTTFAIYAHASAGCLHIRPLINLKTTQGLGQYRRIAEAVADLVLKYEGTITGEHGEGYVRGEFREKMFGAELVGAFQEIKTAFDPLGLMNPGKGVAVQHRMDDPTILRYNPAYQVLPVTTRYDWSTDRGLIGAVEMCNGSGVCRKEGSGTMCPSYMATLDEKHSTRGRANALRLAMTGQLAGGVGSAALKEVYDLCLACKACQSECPSTVDVARMKAEVLTQYYAVHGTPLAAQIFGNVHRLNRLGGLVPRLSNALLNSPLGQWGLKWAGIATERPLPQFAPQRFSQLVGPQKITEAQGTLIMDTFTEYNHPEIGVALVKIAQAANLRLQVLRLPGSACCGRPAISKGLLDQAKSMAQANVRFLAEHLGDGPFIFLEPSCQSAFTDDYLTLVDAPWRDSAKKIAVLSQSAESWLLHHAEALPQPKGSPAAAVLLHGHCHQKALWGTADTLALLRRLPDCTVQEIDSGCCGMAGSFGYEHPDLSRQIAQQRLLPAVSAQPLAHIAAAGTSCRAQLADFGQHARHPIEILAQALELA
jgi:Fe-S oxidoreductase